MTHHLPLIAGMCDIGKLISEAYYQQTTDKRAGTRVRRGSGIVEDDQQRPLQKVCQRKSP